MMKNGTFAFFRGELTACVLPKEKEIANKNEIAEMRHFFS